MGMTVDTLIQALQIVKAQEQGVGYKHDLPAGTTMTTNYMHGPTGIFGVPGLERDVFSTRVRPTGLLSQLPSKGVNIMYPVVGYLTGFTDEEDAEEKDGVCDKPIEAGQIKSCMQGSMFGRVERMTEAIELNRIGQVTNRAEMFDLRIVNDPLLQSNFAVSSQISREFQDILNREVLARWYTLGASFEMVLSRMIYTGNVSNNKAGGGYKEFSGLETLVGTGRVDAFTGDACPSLDSYIVNFNYGSVEDDTLALFVELVEMVRFLEQLASSTGLAPVDFRFVMRLNAFTQIVDRWPCVYASFRCDLRGITGADGAAVFVDGLEQRREADAMRTGRYLLIDGQRYPVIIDDSIAEEVNGGAGDPPLSSGQFASDIYFLPFMVRSGIMSTYLEWFDYDSQNGVLQALRDGRLMNEVWSTDSGRFLWTFDRTLWCVAWIVKIEPRLRLLTPHLAGRISNVKYQPHRHSRDPFPDMPYHSDGGRVTRSLTPYDLDNIK